MSFFNSALLVVIALVVLAPVYVRLAPSNAARWHVDPTTAARPRTPNYYFVLQSIPKRPAPVFQADAAELAAAFDAFAVAQPLVVRLAGGVDDLHITYVQRSNTMKYPDYLSVRFIDLGGGLATVAIFSRSRFGIGDRGFNKRRVQKWLKSLDSFARIDPSKQSD